MKEREINNTRSEKEEGGVARARCSPFGHVCARHPRGPRKCVKIDYTAGENVINSSTNKDPFLPPWTDLCVCVSAQNSKNHRGPGEGDDRR